MIQSKRGITIEAYSTGTTQIADPRGELPWAEGLNFSTAFPGGYMDASFYIKRDIVAWWAMKGAQRVVFRQGDRQVYEGYVSSLDRLLDEGGQAIRVPLVGAWSHILMNRRWHKLWCDKRIDESVWKYATARSGAEKCTLDRNSRIRFTPKAEIWLTNELAAVLHTQPTGDTTKRITFAYDMKESGQNWTLGCQGANAEGAGIGTTLWSATADGTGTADITLGTPNQYVRFYWSAGGSQTPTWDGTIYGQIATVCVYSQLGTITPTTVATAIIGKITDLNSGTIFVNSNTLNIEPFISEWDDAANILTRACSFGDASNNRWAAYILGSESVASPDGKPVLGIRQYPALTDYDLALRLNETNIAGAIEINQDFSSIYNWVVVEYADENGWPHWITPDDDATLKDMTSMGLYGQRDYVLSLGYSTSTVATNNGKRFLAAYKDPQWNASPIPIWDYIRRKPSTTDDTKTMHPARIPARFRLKVEDFTTDLSGTGLTMLITGTRYDDESGINTLTFGQPQSPLMTILTPPPRIIPDVAAGGGGDGDGGGGGGPSSPPVGFSERERLNWKRKWGIDESEWGNWNPKGKGFWKRKQAFIKAAKAKRKKRG